MASVLVVEDEPKVAAALCQGLEDEGYTVAIATSGEEAYFRVSNDVFSLILLDLTLPGRDGLEILRALRRRDHETRVLILTARDGLAERVAGLDAGADDYMVKPFAFAELLARVRALERRRAPAGPLLAQGDVQMDLYTRRVTRSGRALDLTAREFSLLEYLLRAAGQVVSRDSLARDVWQQRERSSSVDNVIDAHIARLRKKVDDDGQARLIHTIRGVGFTLREQQP